MYNSTRLVLVCALLTACGNDPGHSDPAEDGSTGGSAPAAGGASSGGQTAAGGSHTGGAPSAGGSSLGGAASGGAAAGGDQGAGGDAPDAAPDCSSESTVIAETGVTSVTGGLFCLELRGASTCTPASLDEQTVPASVELADAIEVNPYLGPSLAYYPAGCSEADGGAACSHRGDAAVHLGCGRAASLTFSGVVQAGGTVLASVVIAGE